MPLQRSCLSNAESRSRCRVASRIKQRLPAARPPSNPTQSKLCAGSGDVMMQHACRHICEFSRQFVHTLRLLSASVMFFWSTRCADAGVQGVEGHRCAHMAHALSARTTVGGGVELGHVGGCSTTSWQLWRAGQTCSIAIAREVFPACEPDFSWVWSGLLRERCARCSEDERNRNVVASN